MRHTCWSRILVIGTAMLLMSCPPVFSQEGAGQEKKKRVGQIVRVIGTIYWKLGENDNEVEIKAKDAKKRPLYPGESLRCGPNSLLVIKLYGRKINISEQMGWYPIPFAMDKRRDPKRQIEESKGTTGGRTASMDTNPAPQPFIIHPVQVQQGIQLQLQGVVSLRSGDTFKVRDVSGAETTVLLTPETDVTSHSRGLRGKKDYPVTYIMRGLRLQAQGRGDAEGNLVADWVRFDEQDLRSAQALKQTDELAQDNEARISAAEEAYWQAEEEARRMAGQIAENTALANNTRARAEGAQAQADAAFKAAALVNNRINGLDDYDTIGTTAVLFKVGSSVLTPEGREELDETAAWAKREMAKGNTNGWLVEVVGFADTLGNTAKNRRLSERRAKAVIQYLVGVHGLDLRRLVQPFGFGKSPVADNKTAVGRAKNRRVEIRILQNKGIANTMGGS
jgi:OmpA-OmpF porin, OOP family